MKLSVHMITYNHEKFIAQAIESVLMQETDFDYELIIGEDCSTDNTRGIVQDYHRRYPERIRVLLHENNVGMGQNGRLTREACNGQYVAMLEGDDYWTSPHKLQKQVDYMDAYPECAICFTRAAVVYEGNADDSFGPYWPNREPKEITTFEDLIVDHDYIPTCATVYRNHLISEFPEWFHRAPISDWPLHLLNAQHGYIYYISEAMAAYRKHSGGITANRSAASAFQIGLEILEALWPGLDTRYRGAVRAEIGRMCYRLALHYDTRCDPRAARVYAWRRIGARHYESGLENPVRQVMRLYMPGLHRFARTCKRALGGRA